VEYIAFGIPYERRDQLLGTLISLFGSYAATRVVGTAIIYRWPPDSGVALVVRVSKDPNNGILELWVSRISSDKPGSRSN
jgi:hypothetical protein